MSRFTIQSSLGWLTILGKAVAHLTALPMLLFLCLPVNGVAFRWSPTSNRIYVDGPGVVTLRDIHAALPDVPLQLVDPSNQIWYLRANLVIENGAELRLFGHALGGDVDELRLRSDNTPDTNAVVELRADWGYLNIRETRITSWDSATNGPDTETGKYGRAFIHARSSLDPDGVTAHESRMDVIHSDIGYLGFADVESYGLVWKVVDTSAVYLSPGSTNTLFDLVKVRGDILSSRLHDNYFGMYSYGHFGGTWSSNEVDHNLYYGFDAHDDSDYEMVLNNKVHDNGWHGIIASERCDHLVMRDNQCWNNGKNGIMLHRHCNDSLVESNRCYLNGDSGIVVFDTERAEVRDNICLSNANSGIRLSLDSANNHIENNEVGFSGRYAIYLFPGSSIPEPDDTDPITNGRPRLNTFFNNFLHDYGVALRVQNADSNTFILNRFQGSGPVMRFENSIDNLLSSNSLAPDVLLKLAGNSTNLTSLTIQGQPSVTLQLDPYSTGILRDDTGAVFDFAAVSVPTSIYPTDSVASVGLQGTSDSDDPEVGLTSTVLTRNLRLAPDAGVVTAQITSWNHDGDLSKSWTAHGSNGTSSITYQVGDLLPGTTYAVAVGAAATLLGNFTADAQGSIRFVSASPDVDTAYRVQPTTATSVSPVLPHQTDRTVPVLTLLRVTNSVSESVLPPSALHYELLTPPAGAQIDGNGVITWLPTSAQSLSTNILTTVVTENGTPQLSATNVFNVVVVPMTLSIELKDTNSAVLSWPAPSGQWVLQHGDGKSAWIPSTNIVVVVGERSQTTISPLSGSDFFRLFHP
jgi:parallel beta-helix repeat protein